MKKTDHKKSNKQIDNFKTTKTNETIEPNSKFKKQIITMRSDIKNIKTIMTKINNQLNLLESIHKHDVIKSSKMKKKTNSKPSGFLTPEVVPEKIAKFLEITPDTKLSRPQIASQIWKKMKEKKLLGNDKRVFQVDKEVSELLGVPMSVNKIKKHDDVTNGFNFRNLQKVIAKAFKK